MAGPTTLQLPSFRGATRRLVLMNLVAFFGMLLLGAFSRVGGGVVLNHLLLVPHDALLGGQVWQLVTYSLLNPGLLQILFGLLSLWFVGTALEERFGARWIYEVYFTSAIGGALIASLLSLTGLVGISPFSAASGMYAAVFGLLIGFGRYFGDQPIRMMFLIELKARYMVAIYILLDLAFLLRDGERFGALVHLCAAFSAWLYFRFVPRQGFSYAASEQMYGLRNSYIKSKRRRAAKQFEVYMGKQGREVRFDNDGKFVDPDLDRNPTRDPNDKRWMN